jgi:D-alanine-D-alanine ligase
MRNAVRNFVKVIYARMNMKGSVRMDFLIDNTDGSVYLNEVNTIPGSLAYYLFSDNGLSFFDLVDIAAETAIGEKIKSDRKRSGYQTRVF